VSIVAFIATGIAASFGLIAMRLTIYMGLAIFGLSCSRSYGGNGVGRAIIIDGDTLWAGGQEIRLPGQF